MDSGADAPGSKALLLPCDRIREKGGDIMFKEKYDAYVFAMDLTKIILANPAVNAYPTEDTAESIADFIETLADKLTDKD